jgi:hypothetical protein
MKQRLLLAGLAGSVLVILGIAFAEVRLSSASSPLPALGNGSVAALDRAARTTADTLPRQVQSMPAGDWLASRDRGVRVLSDSERMVWIAAGKSGSICLVLQETREQTTSIDCAPRSILTKGPLYASSLDANGAATVVGLVDDAVSSVRGPANRDIPIQKNLFVLRDVTSDSVALTLSASSGSRTFSIAGLRPR